MIYTIGHAPSYDLGLAKAAETGIQLRKRGPFDDYPGGYAFRTASAARRRIDETYRGYDFAVYAVDADWEIDVERSARGWWGALQRDAVILRRVEDNNGG